MTNPSDPSEKEPMTLRELFHSVLRMLPWREEAQQLEAQRAVEHHFGDEQTTEAVENRTESGVKDANGDPWKSEA